MSAARPAPPPAGPPAGPPGMPPPARVAVILLAVVGTLLLLNAVLTWVGREGVVEAYLRSQPDATRADADRLVLVSVGQGVLFGLPAVVSAWALARGKAWARWAGVVAAGLLALVTLWLSIDAGGIAVTSLLLLVFCVAAVACLLAPATAGWTRSGARDHA